MKLSYLCLKHPPTDGRVYYKISKTLKKQGHEIINIHPNIKDQLTEDGIQLLGYTQATGLRGRIQSFENARAIALKAHPDIIIAAEPDALYVALGIKKSLKNTKIIFDCHEWYSEHFSSRLKLKICKSIISRAVSLLTNRLVKKCDAVISVNNSMAQYYSKYNSNSYTIPSIAENNSNPDMTLDRKNFIYFGQFGTTEQECLLIKAAKILKAQGCSAHIVVIGGSKNQDRFSARISEMDILENISIINWLPREQAFVKLNEGCAGIMRFDMHTFGLPALPNKIFEYLAAGMAIIGSSLNPEVAKIIDEEKCGISVPHETPEALAKAIQYLHDNPEICRQMGQNALNSVREKYNWDRYGRLLENILLQVSRKES